MKMLQVVIEIDIKKSKHGCENAVGERIQQAKPSRRDPILSFYLYFVFSVL